MLTLFCHMKNIYLRYVT